MVVSARTPKTRAVPGPRFRRGRGLLPAPAAGAGAWRPAPALYRGRGLKFLFCTHKNEIFSASKILKTAKKALKIEPKVKKHIVSKKLMKILIKYVNFEKSAKNCVIFKNFQAPANNPEIPGAGACPGASAPGPGPGTALPKTHPCASLLPSLVDPSGGSRGGGGEGRPPPPRNFFTVQNRAQFWPRPGFFFSKKIFCPGAENLIFFLPNSAPAKFISAPVFLPERFFCLPSIQ